MTVELLPHVVTAPPRPRGTAVPSRPRPRGTAVPSRGAVALRCACGATGPDCLYCTGPESD